MRHFHARLDDLFRRVVAMGTLAESMIRDAVAALVARDEAALGGVFAREHEAKALQAEIDDHASERAEYLQCPTVGSMWRGVVTPQRVGVRAREDRQAVAAATFRAAAGLLIRAMAVRCRPPAAVIC